MFENNTYQAGQTSVEAQALTNVFLRGVYKWMSIGLAVTAIVAWNVATSEAALNFIFGNSIVFYGMIIAELGLVMAISWAINKLSSFAATSMFLLYSALTGATLSSIFIVFQLSSIMQIFIASAVMFGAMSVYGLITKRDLTSMGSLMRMGLIGILVASLINMFVGSPALDYAISIIGVIVFLGLTAFDTQKLRAMGQSAPMDDALAIRRGTILGALTLYLDFINLFIMLLRIFGDRR